MSDALISIILPVHNQADHIGKIVQEYSTALAKIPNRHEFWLVANACKDNTVQVCEELSRTNPAVNCLALEKGGWGSAVKAGLAKANGDIAQEHRLGEQGSVVEIGHGRRAPFDGGHPFALHRAIHVAGRAR